MGLYYAIYNNSEVEAFQTYENIGLIMGHLEGFDPSAKKGTVNGGRKGD